MDTPDEQSLQRLIGALGMPVRDVMRRKVTPYEPSRLDDANWAEDQLLEFMLAQQSVRDRSLLTQGAACSAVAGAAAVTLLGVSGWFIAGAAAAGLAGTAAVHAFNYLLPSAAIRLMAIARTGARYGERVLHHHAALKSMAKVRPMIFGAVCAGGPQRAVTVSLGDAATALTQDCATIEDLLARRGAAWTAAAAALAGIALAAVASWDAALAVLAVIVMLLAVAHLVAPVAGRADTVARAGVAALKDEMAFLASAEPELRCYGLTTWAAERAFNAGHALTLAQARRTRALSLMDMAQAGGTGIAAATCMWLAADAGAPLAALAGLAGTMAIEGCAAFARGRAMQAGFDEATARLDHHLRELLPSRLIGREIEERQSKQDLHAPSLFLRALGGTTWPAGSRIAITGPSGCGKTTLVESLLGFRPLETGSIAIGGRDAEQIDAAQRAACFAWLPQDAMLIAGTVRENLTLVLDIDGGDEGVLWRALQDASIDRRIRSLPHGLDTWIGEDGELLSGGERRRLALARCYLSCTPWLLLDEPTEGLDVGTECEVLDGLRAHLARTGQGLILVTHRAAAMKVCDTTVALGS